MQSWTTMAKLMFHSFGYYISPYLTDWVINLALFLSFKLGILPMWTGQIRFLFESHFQPYSPGSFEELLLGNCPEYDLILHYFKTTSGRNTNDRAESGTVSTQACLKSSCLLGMINFAKTKNSNKSAAVKMGFISGPFSQFIKRMVMEKLTWGQRRAHRWGKEEKHPTGTAKCSVWSYFTSLPLVQIHFLWNLCPELFFSVKLV